ncbi:MAG: UDP-glucose/GDP-mannose dehydrogenase family protein [Pseudomonadota bacterium]|nr:UDP-glucose/GDP-mannose dehydrogenase family protein [Pseudomonadota bacterium]
MKVSVIGLGYVGTVVAGCLAKNGHDVVGIDIELAKVELVRQGRSPIVEPEIGAILDEQVHAGRLTATTDLAVGVRQSDIVLICVGTPAANTGAVDLGYLRRVCEEIGTALRQHPGAPIIAVRSTVPPGTTREHVIPVLERASGLQAGADFGVCVNPEFLREGSAVRDFYDPPKTVIGEINRTSGDALAVLYAGLPGPMVRTDPETAELVKYAANSWHALKIGFANEIGNICKAFGVDAHQLMDIFCKDRKLNISTAYLKPGFAFGGYCLPKDLKALVYAARKADVSTPILAAVLPSNEEQIERAVQAVIAAGKRKIGILGISFKAGTDDLRGSPQVEMAERLLGKGFDIRVYDRNVNMAKVMGANRAYILERIPHLSCLMVDTMDELISHADTIVVGNASEEFIELPRMVSANQTVIDLVRISPQRSVVGVYEGLCW